MATSILVSRVRLKTLGTGVVGVRTAPVQAGVRGCG